MVERVSEGALGVNDEALFRPSIFLGTIMEAIETFLEKHGVILARTEENGKDPE